MARLRTEEVRRLMSYLSQQIRDPERLAEIDALRDELVKRYAEETGSAWVESLTDPRVGNRIYVAAITHVESSCCNHASAKLSLRFLFSAHWNNQETGKLSESLQLEADGRKGLHFIE
jgi:hypothetical protein